ncbi:MAG TPA: hypothetical protein VFP56_12670 [Candidatus Limnocylindrales bacterium]|nr:hypothetical protein [Candidatus Limnocylindrales bacterium]
MTDDRLPRCDRTRGLIDRVVGERVTPEDRAHAAGCERCGTVLLRASRFDDELRTTARGLVGEQLPHGVLDAELAPRLVDGLRPMRHAAPGIASMFAALVILVVAVTVAVAPGGLGPGATPQDTGLQFAVPVFRATVDIIRDVQAMEYSCIPGHALPTTGPGARLGEREGVACLTPKSLESATARITPVETREGKVVEITITGEQYGASTVTSRDELADVMSKLTALSISDPKVARDAAAFVLETLPRLRVLTSGDDALVIYGNVRILLQRYIAGDYRLTLQPT